ncbi:MAG TPA: hypothetical protein VH834_05885 [Solirubrobacteraceae bacterium]
MDRGPLACTDAERRAALALAGELRAAGRTPRLEARWVRPGWPAWQALCAIAGAAGSVISVDHPLTGLIVVGVALAISLGHGRGRLPLGRARATQDVVAPAPAPRAVTLVVLAAVDRPRASVLDRVPAALQWLQGALLLTTGFAAARLAGAEGTLVGACQLVPTVVLLLAAAGLLDAAFEPPAPSDAAATRTAVALAAVPWAEIVLVGAGELGLRARLRSDRRAPEEVVLLWLEPAGQAGWRSVHPTLAAIAQDTGASRRRGRALPAGTRPALALSGPDGALAGLARTVVARLEPYSESARSTK